MPLGKIRSLRGILIEIIEFPWLGLFRANLLTHGLPLAIHDSKLSSVSMKFPDHRLSAEEGLQLGGVANER